MNKPMGERMSQDCLDALEGSKSERREETHESSWQRATQTPVWTEAMVKALGNQGQSGKPQAWFSLMDKVSSNRAIAHGWVRVTRNAGSPGVDGMSTERFASQHEKLLSRLQEELKAGTYRPQPIKRVMIPKADGKQRPLGIPTVRDRIVQAAVLEVIEPIFEHQFEERSYGFRPGRGCKDALREVLAGFDAGLWHVVDADLKSYFDTIPHDRLMQRVFASVKDGSVLRLIERFLQQRIVSDLESWTPSLGTPQGAVLSPLLANLYLHPLDQQMREAGFRMIRYADDFIVQCVTADDAHRALAMIQTWVEGAGLSLHPEKTRVADLSVESDYIDFLGYRFQRKGRRIERRIKPKKMTALKATIRALTPRVSGKSMDQIVTQLNQTLRGIFEYFKHVTGWQERTQRASDLQRLDARVRYRLRRLLAKRQHRHLSGRSLGAHQRWSIQYFADLGLFSMQAAQEQILHSR
jgi:RNA-directed DNA polymerase